MKKLAATLAVACLVLATGVYVPSNAHAQTAPGGDDLATTASRFRTAYLTGTPEELFNSLAPWLQGRANLYDERFVDFLEEMVEPIEDEAERAEFLQALKDGWVDDMRMYDPADKLGLKTFDDAVALSPSQMVALELSQYRVQGREEVAAHRNARWHEIHRRIYTEEEDGALVTYGEVVYRNKFKDEIEVICAADGDAWQIVDFNGQIGEEFLMLELSISLTDPRDMFDSEEEEGFSPTEEAEQLMRSGRGYARVQYAKTAEAPRKFSDSLKNFEEEFTGEYFKLRNKIYKKPDMDRGAIVAEPLEGDDWGYAALYFDYISGESDIKWYDTREELDKALKAFETAK